MKIITQNSDLANICAEFAKCDYITVDTEFMRETTFWPKLCLIQIASDNIQYIIDPIDNLDLAPFFQLMVNKNIVKVFHAARQDIEIFYYLSGALPTPIFDTQIAAMVCGFGDQISYSNLVESVTKKTIDKKSQYTDWARRPLSQTQLEYALADVTYLRTVYKNLKNKLVQTKRTTWLEEEMKILTDVKTYDPPDNMIWRRIKTRLYKPEELAVLQILACWRETRAKELNTPRNRILRDEVLQDIAQQQPTTIEQVKQLRSLPNKLTKEKYAKDILMAVKQGLEMPEEQRPQIKKNNSMPKNSDASLALLKMLLQIVATREGVAARLIATANQLTKFVNNPNEENEFMNGWRYDIFGKLAEQMISGKLFIGLEDNRIVIVDQIKR